MQSQAKLAAGALAAGASPIVEQKQVYWQNIVQYQRNGLKALEAAIFLLD